jgi:hypothetical protein
MVTIVVEKLCTLRGTGEDEQRVEHRAYKRQPGGSSTMVEINAYFALTPKKRPTKEAMD